MRGRRNPQITMLAFIDLEERVTSDPAVAPSEGALLIALYSVRSERALCEELPHNRWFLDMGPIEPAFDPTVFTNNRDRLLKHEVGQQATTTGRRTRRGAR